MHAEVVAGPLPSTNGTLTLVVEVGGVRLPVSIVATRGVGVAEDVPVELASAAMRAVFQFSRTHDVLVHVLLRRADDLANTPDERRAQRFLLRAPALDSRGLLVFNVHVDDMDVRVRVTPDLRPVGFEQPGDAEPTEERFFGAYDASLAHMLLHVEELRSLGFDTTELERQLSALPDDLRPKPNDS